MISFNIAFLSGSLFILLLWQQVIARILINHWNVCHVGMWLIISRLESVRSCNMSNWSVTLGSMWKTAVGVTTPPCFALWDWMVTKEIGLNLSGAAHVKQVTDNWEYVGNRCGSHYSSLFYTLGSNDSKRNFAYIVYDIDHFQVRIYQKLHM